MKKIRLICLILMLASTATFALPLKEVPNDQSPASILTSFPELLINQPPFENAVLINAPIDPLTYYKAMFEHEASTLNPYIANKALMALYCADKYGVQYSNIFSIIDYAKPSNEKRIWVFDLKKQKLLYHTYVSHGIKNGERWSQAFSNKQNSKASSIGLYLTQGIYYGREGISLRLDGLERRFNNNANNRYIVMHGGWYVNEDFIKKYTRAGRSWGCPALPKKEVEPIIRTIENHSLMLAYYPDESWLSQSNYLHCQKNDDNRIIAVTKNPQNNVPANLAPESRETILYADLHHRDYYVENNPVITIKASEYARKFLRIPPLGRMLRRQINHEEYIVLTSRELDHMIKNKADFTSLYFIIPVIKNVRGYYETIMQPVVMGKIKTIEENSNTAERFTAHLESNKTIQLRSHNGFIRWIGL